MDNVPVLWLLFVTLLHSACSMHRTLRSWMNPECGDVCKEKNITTVYLRADGPNDTLHYLWDFNNSPTVLLARTSSSAVLHVSWEDFIARRANSIRFTEDPLYTFGVMIHKIIEFNDLNDTAFVNTVSDVNTNVLNPGFFRWERKSLLRNDEFVALDMEGNSYNDTTMNISRYGSIKLSLRGFCTLDHSDVVPHMLHTENSTQIDIILDNIETNRTFSNSRFAIELLVVGDGDPNIPMFVDPKKSLDDEYTPGIFEVVEVRTPPFKRMDDFLTAGAYLQWRPVSYTNVSRDVTSSTETVQYPPMKVANRTNAIENSMLYCYYGNQTDDLLVQKITVSFGTKGDGFYNKMHYSTWTFLIGYGTPPDERFSYLVIMIISIGLGLPVLIILAAGFYVCIRKIPKRNNELCLNR